MTESSDRRFRLFDDQVPFSGRCLIEASAGTGKTYNLSGLFVRLIAENKFDAARDPSRIVVVTYTRAATRELRERITERLRGARDLLDSQREVLSVDDDFLKDLKAHYEQDDEALSNLKDAVEHIDELSVYTIHGFAHRLLLEFGPLANIDYTGEIVTDARDFTFELIYDYWRDLVAGADEDTATRALLKILREDVGTPDGFMNDYGDLLTDQKLDFKYSLEFDEFRDLVNQGQEQFKVLQEALDAEVVRELETLYLENEPEDLNLNKNEFKPEKWKSRREALEHIKQAEFAIDVDPGEWDTLKYLGYDSIDDKINQAGSLYHLPLSDTTREWMRKLESMMELMGSVDDQKAGLLQFVLEELNKRYFDSVDDRDEYSYDDVLYLADCMVKDNRNGVRKAIWDKYPISLIDEFQDTDPLQWSMFDRVYDESVANDTLLCLIGDPKQSIYRFRGADVNAYLQARLSIQKERRFTLEDNWRSDEKYIEAMNRLWGRHRDAFFAEDIDYRKVQFPNRKNKSVPAIRNQPALEWIVDEAEEATLNKQQARERAAEITARHIKRVLHEEKNTSHRKGSDDEGVKPGDIAVLCGRNREAALMKQKLFEHGLNSVQLSRDNVFDSTEAWELQLILESAAEPTDAAALRAAMGTQMLDAAKLLADLSENGELTAKMQRQWEEWLFRAEEWHRRWTEDGVTALLRYIMEQEQAVKHLLQYHDGERRVTNLRHLSDLLEEIARERPGEIRYLLHELRRRRKGAGERTESEEEELRLESDRDLVNIVTIHRSKGLEYPMVYTPFLWDGINVSDLYKRRPYVYHDPEKTLRKRVDFDGSQYEGSRYYYFREEMQDQLRMAYVALTRGEHHHVTVHVPFKDNYADRGKSSYAAIDYVLFGSERYQKALHRKFTDFVSVDQTRWITYPELIEQIEKLADQAPEGVIEFSKWPIESGDQALTESGAVDNDRQLEYIPFDEPERIRQRWVIQSYSALRRGVEAAEDPALEVFNVQMDEETAWEEASAEASDESSVLAFPAGARTGLCWHRIYEEVQFGDPQTYRPEVRRQLISHGFDEERWTETLHDNVSVVLDKPLEQAENVCLADLKEGRIRKEMEFHFGYDQADAAEILEIIRSDARLPSSRPLPGGLMNGYIDLTFENEDKIYLLDYKSNHLGMSLDDYRPGDLAESIREHYYDLQYHLYTLALHRYLSQRIGRAYRYETHFGGVFYLYLRGIQEDSEATGVFFDRPDRDVIEELDRYFKSERAYG